MVQGGWSPAPGIYPGTRRRQRQMFIAAGIVVAALLAVFAYGQVWGGGCSKYYCQSSQAIDPPAGFEYASELYELNDEPAAAGSTIQLTIPLAAAEGDNRSLAFFAYDPGAGTWGAVTAAEVIEGEDEKVAATLRESPQFLAVMRRLSKAGHVVAYLPPGGALHPDAAGRVTMLHTRDFTPVGDGSLAGAVTQVTRDPSFQFVPTASADAANGLQVVTALLSTGGERSRHVQQVVQAVESASADGIDIAYLDLPADQRSSFTLFVIELAQALHGRGKVLTLTLPAPLAAGGAFNEGAYDWAELSKHADLLQLLPYRDSADYRLVFPTILDYLATRMDTSRLVMTVTPLATEKAADGSLRTMTVVEAMTIAAQIHVDGNPIEVSNNYSVVGVNIDKSARRSGVSWSPETATVFFTYESSGGRTVYIENAFSVGFKLEYVPRYGLGGVAVDNASNDQYLGNIWPAIVPFIETGKPTLAQPNVEGLKPAWLPSGGEFEDDGRGGGRWTAPSQAGSYTITLTLSDGVAVFENQITVAVQPRTLPGTASGG